MPSYVNIGAYVDEGTMVDTWATVGSCAQIGKNVHLSGGVGIGGVLEPLQAAPVIIEDNAFKPFSISKDVIAGYDKMSEEKGIPNPLNDRVLDKLEQIQDRFRFDLVPYLRKLWVTKFYDWGFL